MEQANIFEMKVVIYVVDMVIKQYLIIVRGSCSFCKYKLVDKVIHDTSFDEQYEDLIFTRKDQD